jgi:toxin CptA
MSIAVSVIVRPSLALRVAHAGLCCCVMASAAFCPGVVAPLLCVVLGALAWLGWHPPGIARQLDISGVGRLRLAVYQHNGSTLRLLSGSTLWPRLLLLRLADDAGRAQVVLVLADSVAPEQWRALALACRAIARTEINTPAV